MTNLPDSPLMRAIRHEPAPHTPIWLMRQAGRYMPEYRAIREKVGMLDAISTPDIACEITMQPIKAFALDAAILFSDILIPLIPMGLPLDFVKGEGPQLDQPIRSRDDIARLRVPNAAAEMPFMADAVRQVVHELTPHNIPLIGFGGAPFTLASYAIEGGGSKNFEHTKALMWNDPAAWNMLMGKLVDTLIDYLGAQITAGASVIQLFDSWAGALSPRDYALSVAPHNQRLIAAIQALGVPVIYFSTGTGTMLDQITMLGSDVISIDWRNSLKQAWQAIDLEQADMQRKIGRQALQGNLDPVMLFAEWSPLQAAVDDLLTQARHRDGYIFNLGHGILPGTPIDTVRRLVDYVHEQTTPEMKANYADA